MFTLWGKRQQFCDGISRRNFLKLGAFGAGLSLAEMLRLRAQAGSGSSNKAAIMIYLPGGPPHLDMYHLKPDAPKEFRGEFKPIATNVPGIQIGEVFPRIAARMLRKICEGARGLRVRGSEEDGVLARPERPSRCTLPMTALRVMPPSSAVGYAVIRTLCLKSFSSGSFIMSTQAPDTSNFQP